jgi:ABC-type glycerol-3-phosphate transport system substrate-binding protein
VITTSSLIKFIEQTSPDLQYGTVPLPTTGFGGRGGLLFADAYLITEFNHKIQETQVLIEFLNRAISENWESMANWGLPPDRALVSDLVDRSPAVRAFYEGVTGAVPYSFAFSGVREELDDKINRALNGELTSEEVMQELEKYLQER